MRKKKRCHTCGELTLIYHQEKDIYIKDENVGIVTVLDVACWHCSNCGNALYTPETLDALLKVRQAKLLYYLYARPLSAFCTGAEAAAKLNMSKRELRLHPAVKRGYIYRVKKGVEWLYLEESVQLFIATGDGRFPLHNEE